MLREVALRADAQTAEALADALLAQGALSVAIEDADAQTDAEAPLYGEPGSEPAFPAWPRNRLLVLLEAGIDPDQMLLAVAAALQIEPPPIEAARMVEDADWVRLTQSQFTPTQIADDIWIVPSWHDPPDAGAINIRLDPGVAFGTGTHPTTRLCLQWLAQHRPAGKQVLDYGCGSGVLAIAAMRLGARRAVGIDIDPQAVEAARANSAINGVSARYTTADLPPDGSFDVVLANILANPLRVLAPALIARVARGGSLLLSGILERQADELIDVYRAAQPSLELVPWRAQDGWVCLVGDAR